MWKKYEVDNYQIHFYSLKAVLSSLIFHLVLFLEWWPKLLIPYFKSYTEIDVLCIAA